MVNVVKRLIPYLQNPCVLSFRSVEMAAARHSLFRERAWRSALVTTRQSRNITEC